MDIHLPKDVESSVNAEVLSGHCASPDALVAEIVRDYFRRRGQEQPPGESEAAAPAHRPIWEEIDEITASVPDEEFLKLPVDGAEQHDHYIYGTPKRPPAP